MTVDVLNTSTPVDIGSTQATIHTPILGPTTDENWTRDLDPPPIPGAQAALEARGDNGWGRVTQLSGEQATDASMAYVVVEFVDLDPEHQATEAVRQGLAMWLARLGDWIEVWSKQVLAPPYDADPRVPAWWVVLDEEEVPGRFAPGHRIHLGTFQEGGPSLDLRGWLTGLARASDAEKPPLAHRVLADARAALRRKHEREAVLHAATAVELVVEAALTDKLATLGDDATEWLLKRIQSISARLQLAKTLGVPLPTTLQTDLIKPRNDVAHKGQRPPASPATAPKAVKLAEQVVDQLAPIHP